MSSAVLSELAAIRQNDYTSLIRLTVIGYDYVLTFPKEIEYVWGKPWTWVSTLFIFVRYCGMFSYFTIALGKYFSTWPGNGEIIYIINQWTFVLFLGAADIVMILRVWAMYKQSRLVLITLLTSFFVEIIVVILSAAIYSDPKIIGATIVQISNASLCGFALTTIIWSQVTTIFQLGHATVVCMFAIAQFLRESLQMYRATKQWQLNRYMSLLVKQGIVYFFSAFVYFILNLFDMLGIFQPTSGWQWTVFDVIQLVPMYTLTPRFILSTRELYARNVQGGRADGIDTGFGLSSSGFGAGRTPIVFADVGQSESLDGVEEVGMEVMGVGETRPN